MARDAGARIIGTGRERDRARVLEAGAELFADLDWLEYAASACRALS